LASLLKNAVLIKSWSFEQKNKNEQSFSVISEQITTFGLQNRDEQVLGWRDSSPKTSEIPVKIEWGVHSQAETLTPLQRNQTGLLFALDIDAVRLTKLSEFCQKF
jgi:hypothetical protein